MLLKGIGLIFLDQAKLQLRGVFDQALHAVRIIDSGEFHDDLVLDFLSAFAINLEDWVP